MPLYIYILALVPALCAGIIYHDKSNGKFMRHYLSYTYIACKNDTFIGALYTVLMYGISVS